MSKRLTERQRSISLGRSDVLVVLGILLVPSAGPLGLHIWAADDDLDELWAVIFGPISCLVAGMAVSQFKATRLRAASRSPDRQRLARHPHDVQIVSLLFLALFEGTACILALVPDAPPGVLVLACCFYVPYVACAIVWWMIMKRLRIAE